MWSITNTNGWHVPAEPDVDEHVPSLVHAKLFATKKDCESHGVNINEVPTEIENAFLVFYSQLIAGKFKELINGENG